TAFRSRFAGFGFIAKVASVPPKPRRSGESARAAVGVLSLLVGACTADVQRSGEASGAGASAPTGGTRSTATGGSGNGSSSGGSAGSGAGTATGGSGNGTSSGGTSSSSGGSGNAAGVPALPDDCDPAARTSSTPL